MFQRQSTTVDFISSNYSFHRMTVDFPVLSPVCCVFHLKVCCILCKFRENQCFLPDWCLLINIFTYGVFIISLYTHKVSICPRPCSI